LKINCSNVFIEEEAEQREFEQRRVKELEELRNAYSEREHQKRINQRAIGSLHGAGAGRTWTIDENKRILMPGSISNTCGQDGLSSMSTTFVDEPMDESSSRKQIEASMASVIFQDQSDDGSISREPEQRNGMK